jgi:ribosomal protein S18 acetylase RimI-like enzyme
MRARPATAADLPLLTELFRRWDTVQFGAPEHDESEVRETFGNETLEERTRLLFVDDRLVAAAWYWSGETILLVDPELDPAPLYADLLPWLAARHVPIDALATDDQLQHALDTGGWKHERSSFELIRRVSGDWTPAEPRWPDGVELTDLRDLEAVHRLIYLDAAWAEVPGHPERAYADWRGIFVTDKEDPAQQVLAWRDGRLVGVAMGRIFSDGAGWVSQLAVAKSERGRGLGRALLLESFRRRVTAGATLLGLSVQGNNRDAIGLYLDVGLTIDREWMRFGQWAASCQVAPTPTDTSSGTSSG